MPPQRPGREQRCASAPGHIILCSSGTSTENEDEVDVFETTKNNVPSWVSKRSEQQASVPAGLCSASNSPASASTTAASTTAATWSPGSPDHSFTLSELNLTDNAERSTLSAKATEFQPKAQNDSAYNRAAAVYTPAHVHGLLHSQMLNYSLPAYPGSPPIGFLGSQPVSYLASPPVSQVGSPPVNFYGCGPFVSHNGYYQPAHPVYPAAPPPDVEQRAPTAAARPPPGFGAAAPLVLAQESRTCSSEKYREKPEMPGRRTSSEKKKKLKKRSPKCAEEKPAAGPAPSADRRSFTLAQLRGTALLPDAPSSPADRPAAKKPLLPLRLPSGQASPRAAGRGKQVVQDRASLARRAGGGRLRPGSDSSARLQSRSGSLSGPSPLSTTLPCLSSFTSPSTCSPDTGPRLSGSRDSLASSSWAAEVEEELAPPTTYASLLSRSLQGRSPATPTTPPTPYTPGSRDGCCDQDDSFFPASGRLPGYTIHRADLQPGAVWDSHCHLDFLSRKLAREGTRNGEQLEVSLRLDGENLGDRFGGCIANFCDPRDWASGRQGQDMTAVLQSCRTQHRVFLAVGCHPHFADRLNGAQLLQLERLAGRLQGRLVAIGECGIDRSRKNDIPMQVQRKSFTAQVRLALKLRLPLVLHIRDAEEEGRAVLREQDVPAEWPIHRHCFNDSWAVAEEWLNLYPGSKIGLTGLVTYGHAAAVHEVARRIPLDRLLLETDAPYFLPAGVSKATYRHRFAQPGHVVHVAAQVAALRGLPLEEVLRANRRNIEEVYRIPMDAE